MIITDVFNHEGRTALYCKAEEKSENVQFLKAHIDGETFDIIKHEKLTSISGDESFVLLINTNSVFERYKRIIVE